MHLGDSVAKDMVAVRIGPALRTAVVSAPSYFAEHPTLKSPREYAEHKCIHIRMATAGGLYPWELEKEVGGRHVRVEGCEG